MRHFSLAVLTIAIALIMATTSECAPTVAQRRARPVLGANFPPSDPTGAKMLASAAESRQNWHQGVGRVAGVPSWNLSNLFGKNYGGLERPISGGAR